MNSLKISDVILTLRTMKFRQKFTKTSTSTKWQIQIQIFQRAKLLYIMNNIQMQTVQLSFEVDKIGFSQRYFSSFKSQKTTTESFWFLNAHATGGRQNNILTNAVLFMINHDYQLTNILENESFVQFMNPFSPNIKFHRETLSLTLQLWSNQ